jgi:nucleoside 2-deoxyribosyltransferase
MTRVYLAAPYPCLDDALIVAMAFKSRGIGITSRWLYESAELNGLWARNDLADVARADVVVILNPPEWRELGTGGRHVELGFAIALWKPIVLIGAASNIFHRLPEVHIVPAVTDAITEILRFGDEAPTYR